MVLRYRYAQEREGRLVDIGQLTRDNRHALGPFRCLGCGDGMVPALGEKMAHHFRHKHEQACSRETYLHRTAKLVFVDAFTAAAAAKRPFLVRRPRAEVCRKHEAQFGQTCSFRDGTETFDLTRWVSRARLEAQVQGFVADVLLENADGSVQLLVEIAVTHRCEPEKIASGLRIMEIPIEDEEGIACLREGLVLDGLRGRGYNLAERPPAERTSCRDCQSSVTLFVVYESGKSILTDFSLEEAHQLLNKTSVLHYEVTSWEAEMGEDRPIELIARHVMRARYDLKLPVRSCTLCRRGGLSWMPDDSGAPIRCFERQAYVGHNEAATCPDYMLFSSREKLVAERRMQKRRAPETTSSLLRPFHLVE